MANPSRIRFGAFLLAFAALSLPVLAEVPAEVRAKAAPVFAALDRIEAEVRTPASPAPGSRRFVFGEDEFNAYAACRLEKEPYVKSALLKLLAGNKVEGRIHIDLGPSQAQGLLPQKQDLLFAAGFETKQGKIRIDMTSLYLGTQAISPAFIDLVIGVVSRLQGVEATSLKDWYDLPSGVVGLETRPGQVVIIY